MRNALERARLRHASRVIADQAKVGKADLMRIEAEDILKSRVFGEGEDAPADDDDDRDSGDSGSGDNGKADDDESASDD